MTKRIYLDVDGVLNAFGNPPGTQKYKFPLQGTTYTLYLNPSHGEQLLQLALDTGAELVWGTMWEEQANSFIGPIVGLPTLPVVPIKRDLFHCTIGRLKSASVAEYSPCDDFVFLDDEYDVGAYFDYYKLKGKHIHVEPYQGLQQAHLDEAREYLLS